MSKIRLTKKMAIDGAGWLERGAEIDLGERFNTGLVNVGRAVWVEEVKPTKTGKYTHVKPEPIEPIQSVEETPDKEA